MKNQRQEMQLKEFREILLTLVTILPEFQNDFEQESLHDWYELFKNSGFETINAWASDHFGEVDLQTHDFTLTKKLEKVYIDSNNLKRVNGRKWFMEVIGRYLGYPSCCVDEAVKSQRSDVTEDQWRWKLTGFTPCKKCTELLIRAEIGPEVLIHDRKCPIPFPLKSILNENDKLPLKISDGVDYGDLVQKIFNSDQYTKGIIKKTVVKEKFLVITLEQEKESWQELTTDVRNF
jgi:hypothetical protein